MDKAELRRAVIAQRDALDLDVRTAKSTIICARLVELLDRSDAVAPHTVAVYAAMGSEADPATFGGRDGRPCHVCRHGRQTWLARSLSVHALGN